MRAALAALVLLASCGTATEDPATRDLPPNHLRLVTRPVVRVVPPESDKLGFRSRLDFEHRDLVYSALWGKRGAPDPVLLDPDTTYEFLIQWLGWHIDVCEVISVKKDGELLWENPAPWEEGGAGYR